jgi:hypothetical protein
MLDSRYRGNEVKEVICFVASQECANGLISSLYKRKQVVQFRHKSFLKLFEVCDCAPCGSCSDDWFGRHADPPKTERLLEFRLSWKHLQSDFIVFG